MAKQEKQETQEKPEPVRAGGYVLVDGVWVLESATEQDGAE
jgi:hypothetical protein